MTLMHSSKKEATYEISDVIFNDKRKPPVIAHFANGDLNRHVLPKSESVIYGDSKNLANYEVAVTCDNILYRGGKPSEGPFRTLLAIQDRGSNKVRMVEIEKVSLYPRHLQSDEQTLITLVQRSRGDLFKTFGSKQIKRRTEQQERMRIDVENIADHLKETAEKANIDDVDTSENVQYSFSHVPCNRDATNILDVYKLEDIIHPVELDSLEAEAESALASSRAERAEKYSEFFCDLMDNLPADNQMYRTKILMYAECIIWFMKIPPVGLAKKSCIVCPVSEIINEKLLNTFTQLSDKGRRLRPTALKDKALSFVIVSSLIAMKFTLNLSQLVNSAKVSLNKLLDLSRNLGAVPVKDKKSVIVLKLPLPPSRKPLPKKKNSFR